MLNIAYWLATAFDFLNSQRTDVLFPPLVSVCGMKNAARVHNVHRTDKVQGQDV